MIYYFKKTHPLPPLLTSSALRASSPFQEKEKGIFFEREGVETRKLVI
jgi:hypothetical protein